MRGYFSFLLVFLAAFSFIYFVLAFTNLNNYNQAKPIMIKQLYQKEMNLKEVSRELARQAARDGFLMYRAEVAITGGASNFDIEEAKQRIKDAIYVRFVLFDQYLASEYKNENTEVSFWCSASEINSDVLSNAKTLTQNSKSAQPCAGSCFPVKTSACRDAIEVSIDLANASKIEESKITIGLSRFGFSLYSKNQDLAAVGYIPRGGRVYIDGAG